MNVSEQFASDVVVTAIEAGHTYGIGYWARVLEYQHTPEPAWAEIEEYDESTGQGLKRARLDVGLVRKGIEALASGSVKVNAEMLGNVLAAAATDDEVALLDGPMADVIVQAGMFGELVYG